MHLSQSGSRSDKRKARGRGLPPSSGVVLSNEARVRVRSFGFVQPCCSGTLWLSDAVCLRVHCATVPWEWLHKVLCASRVSVTRLLFDALSNRRNDDNDGALRDGAERGDGSGRSGAANNNGSKSTLLRFARDLIKRSPHVWARSHGLATLGQFVAQRCTTNPSFTSQ